MVTPPSYSTKRISRYFSEDFKRKKVKEIEKNMSTVAEVSKIYEVSRTSVHNWLNQYNALYQKGYRQVVEAKSDTQRIKQLQEKIKHLEQTVGQKQLKIDFLDKVIGLTEQTHGIDIKTRLFQRPMVVLEAKRRPKDQNE